MTDAPPDWSRAFDDPIPLPDRRVLKTLHDAALPRAEREQAAWQTAAEMLIMAAEDQRPVMFAHML